mmetsp:Transcript_18788/g.30348  ORF Transcript_18788/g.30348 Transcript_18788/m.30348 type:complete len:139 (+) Transcript_18788:290-706(+)
MFFSPQLLIESAWSDPLECITRRWTRSAYLPGTHWSPLRVITMGECPTAVFKLENAPLFSSILGTKSSRAQLKNACKLHFTTEKAVWEYHAQHFHSFMKKMFIYLMERMVSGCTTSLFPNRNTLGHSSLHIFTTQKVL